MGRVLLLLVLLLPAAAPAAVPPAEDDTAATMVPPGGIEASEHGPDPTTPLPLPRYSKVKLAVHAASWVGAKTCSTAPTSAACPDGGLSSLNNTWPVDTRATVFLVALDVDPTAGIRGAAFGLDFTAYNPATYSGIYIREFNLCQSDLQFASVTPLFPQEPGSGVVVTSATCWGVTPDVNDPEGEAIWILGWLDVTSYDHVGELLVTPRLYLSSPDFQVADCAGATFNPPYPEHAGTLGFGLPGYDPCQTGGPCTTPDPAHSTLPDAFILTPDGSWASTVTVACEDGPLEGVAVELAFAPQAEDDVRWAQGQIHPVVTAVTDAQGEATFHLAGGLCPDVDDAVLVTAGSVPLGTRRALSPDVVNCAGQPRSDPEFQEVGGLEVDAADLDFHTLNLGLDAPCSDFDADGLVTQADVDFAASFLSSTGVPQTPWPDCLPISGLAEAIALVDSLVYVPSPHHGTAVVHHYRPAPGDTLFPAGTVIADWDSSFVKTLAHPSYFFFLDANPDLEWLHPSTFAFVDSTTGVLTVKDANSWPVIDGVESPLISAEAEAAIGGEKKKTPADGYVVPAPTLQNTSTAKACAVLVVGRNCDGAGEKAARVNDVNRMLDYLNANPRGPRIRADNIQVVDGGDYEGATKAQVQAALAAVDPDCKKLYFLYFGHGQNPEAGTGGKGDPGLILRNESGSGSDVLTHKELAGPDYLEGKSKLTQCILLEACFSGSAVPEFADSKIKGTLITSSRSELPTSRCDFVGAFLYTYADSCAKDAAADANGDGAVSLLEAVAWAQSINAVVDMDCPQAMILGDDRRAGVFVKPDAPATQADRKQKFRLFQDNEVTGNQEFGICIRTFYTGTLPSTPEFDAGNVCPWDVKKAGKNGKLQKRRLLVLKNTDPQNEAWLSRTYYFPNPPAPSVRVSRPPAEIVCFDKNGNKTVIPPTVPLQDLRFGPNEEKVVAVLPDDCVKACLQNSKKPPKPGILGLADAVEEAKDPGRVQVYAPGDRVFQPFAVGGDPGDTFVASLSQPQGWELSVSPAQFTVSALVDTEFVAVEGTLPDTVLQGGLVTLFLFGPAPGDTLNLNLEILVPDTLAAPVAGGQTLEHVAAATGAGWTTTGDTTRVLDSQVDFTAPTAVVVDSSGALRIENSSLLSGDGHAFSVLVRGGLSWTGSCLVAPGNGLVVESPGAVIRSGGILDSAGDGLTLVGDQTGADLAELSVWNSLGNGLVLDGTAGCLVRESAIEGSGAMDVVARNGASAELRDCVFDEARVSVEPGSQIARTWSTVFLAQASSGSPILGVELELRDVFGTLLAVDTTATGGSSRTYPLTEFTEDGAGRTPHGPFEITARWLTVDTTFAYSPAAPGFVTLVVADSSAISVYPPGPELPVTPSLAQNRPNPFRSGTRIAFTLPEPGPVRLSVYDVRGRLVETLLDARFDAGLHEVDWKPVGTPPGVYFYRLESAGREVSRKLLLVER